MTNLFTAILKFSIQAGILVLALIILRLILRKAPRRLICALWALVALRLIFPLRIESIFSLSPRTEIFTSAVTVNQNPVTPTSLPPTQTTIIYTPVSGTPISVVSAAPVNFYRIAAYIWLAGMIGMLIYALISWLRLYRLTRESIREDGNIYLCDRVQSPFILGIFCPRIILPFTISETDKPYVLAHERAHLKRRDHLWKPLGFLLLSVYWFNPLLWVAYILLCRDIEMACDEKVLKELGFESKKPYAMALVNAAAPRHMIAACPLAFGETGVKSRIKNILHYKKPAFWVIVTAIILSIVTAVCFLTNPVSKQYTDTIMPDYSADPVSAQYIWSSYEESTSPQDGYGYINLRISNYSDQYIAVGMRNFRVYKDGKLLTPAYTDDTQYYSFYKAGTSNTTMVSVYPYLDEFDTTSTFRLEMDYYSFEETDASDIDGEYEPNVGKDPLGSIAVDFKFLSKEERGDVPDFLDDILYHDIDGDGVEEMLVLSNGPTSGIMSLSVGAYDKNTHKEKYKSNFMGFLGSSYPADNCLSVIKGEQAVLITCEWDFNNPDADPREVMYAIKTDGEQLYFERIDLEQSLDTSDIDSMNVSIDIPSLAYLNKNLAIFDGDCGMVIYDLAEQKITDRLSVDTLNRIGYAVPYVDVTADGRDVYIFDYGDEPNGSRKYIVYSPETHDIIAYMSEFDLQTTNINWFGFSETQYDVRYDNALGNVSARIYRIGDYQYEVSAPGWKIKNLQLTVKNPDGTEKTYKIFA